MDVKTTDNMLRMFAIGFTKKRQTKTTSQNRVKKTQRKKRKRSDLILSMVEDVKGRGGSGYVVGKDKEVLESWFGGNN